MVDRQATRSDRFFKPAVELSGQGDFRHKHQRVLAQCHGLRRQMDIDFRFTATRYSAKQDGFSLCPGVLDLFQGGLLGRGQICQCRIDIRKMLLRFPAHAFLQDALFLERTKMGGIYPISLERCLGDPRVKIIGPLRPCEGTLEVLKQGFGLLDGPAQLAEYMGNLPFVTSAPNPSPMGQGAI